jgi:hypothetical protein
MRKAYTLVLTGCVALGIVGVLVSVLGEWHARRQLPPELQSPEAIQHHFDGAACLGCGIMGFTMVAGAIFMGVIFAIVRLLLELAESRKVSKFR